MSLFFVLYNFLNNNFYLFKGDLEKHTKVKIFAKYLIMTILFPIYKLLNIKKIGFSNFQIEAFSYDNIYQLFGEIFVKGAYFFHSNKKGPILIDAGANIGVATLFFKFLYPESKIWAFEPDPETFKLLERNIENNQLTNVHAYNIAVAGSVGHIDFYTDKPGSVSASTVRLNNSQSKIKVKSQTLSNIISKIKRVDLLKVDIEGSEYLAFADLIRNNSLRDVQEIIVEYHHHLTKSNKTLDQFLALLRSAGYNYQIDGTSLPLYRKNFYEAILIYAYK